MFRDDFLTWLYSMFANLSSNSMGLCLDGHGGQCSTEISVHLAALQPSRPSQTASSRSRFSWMSTALDFNTGLDATGGATYRAQERR